jgi:hypothetical protein
LKPPGVVGPRPSGRSRGGLCAAEVAWPRQRGLSLITLLLWAVVVGAAGLAALRVLPSVNEYYAIRRTVERLATAGGTPAEIRAAFERQREAEPAVAVLRGDDLVIAREDNQLVIRFAYDKEIELMAPVYLLIKYHGRSR